MEKTRTLNLKVFKEPGRHSPRKRRFFASNTSFFTIRDMAAGKPTEKDRFCGMHFFSPVARYEGSRK